MLRRRGRDKSLEIKENTYNFTKCHQLSLKEDDRRDTTTLNLIVNLSRKILMAIMPFLEVLLTTKIGADILVLL